MSILITARARFIGCNTATKLKQNGHDVAVVDNISRVESGANARWLADELGIPVERVDLREAGPIKERTWHKLNKIEVYNVPERSVGVLAGSVNPLLLEHRFRFR